MPFIADHPQKLYVELTTRCNLRCRMCVKHAQGSCIEEGDMDPTLFRRLVPSLARTRFLVLNGIGEPLLHPDLEDAIALARNTMPTGGIIGFQSNGLLLDREMARNLLAVGLDTLCLSLDTLGPESNDEHHRSPVERAIDHLCAARQESKARGFRIGLEVVIKRSNIDQLADIVAWAHGRGVDYLLASHLFPHDREMEAESLFCPNGAEAVALFAKWSQVAMARGLDLANLLAAPLKFVKSEADRQLLAIGGALHQEAEERGITLHFANLLTHDTDKLATIEAMFHRAERLAQTLGLDLTLPSLYAPLDTHRSCPFMTEQAVFIARNGEVMPCRFLWHSYTCMVNQVPIRVQAQPLGSLADHRLETIWQAPTFVAFRREAAGSDHAPCWNCTAGPCADLVCPNLLGANDCYGHQVPCGHCMWSRGWTRCL